MIRLKGMTWDHPRGYDPLVATSRAYQQAHPEVEIRWEKRPLQAFADFPVDQLAAEYDLIVIDHPHVGIVARQRALMPLDEAGRDEELVLLGAQSVGPSHASYTYDGHQWALAIDAAAQVSAYRPDLMAEPPRRWAEVVELARAGKVLWPIKPVDAISSFFTLAANRGTPCAESEARLIGESDGLAVLEALQQVAQWVPRECLAMNPIQALDALSRGDSHAYCPLLYGYSNYARQGFRPHLVRFADIPALGDDGPCGSMLGGTGIAVSSRCSSPAVAADYAFWIAGADCQKTLYFDAGGQPGNAEAWADERINRLAHGFFQDTRETLERAWLRPRYAGYMGLQGETGHLVNAFLAGQARPETTLDGLEAAYRRSRS